MALSAKQKRDIGYKFEHDLVGIFNPTEEYPSEWQSRRLGGASSGLPDLVITNNDDNIIVTVEAKATKDSNRCQVPQNELERCLTTLNMFTRYERRMVVLAFKYLRIGQLGKVSRKQNYRPLVTHFYRIREIYNLKNIKYIYSNYNGDLWWTVHDKNKPTHIKADHCITTEELKKLLVSRLTQELKKT